MADVGIAHRPGRARTWRAGAVVATAAILLSACGHSDPPAATATTTPSSNTSKTSTTDTANGDFGSLKGICGRGTPKPSSERGLKDDKIQVGVLNDATSTLAPGLGAGYIDVAKAFTDWCNAAGGINGRKITFVGRDAQITQAAARITDACQSDFMLVGGATPFDATTVDPRESCKLGAIPSYAASTDAIESKLQALPTRVPAKEANIGLMRRLDAKYGKSFQKIGVLAVDTPSLLQPTEAAMAAMKNAGYGVVSYQKLALTTDNWRTVVQPLVGKVKAVSVAPGDPTGFFRAMSDVGYEPDLMFNVTGNAYSQQLVDSLKAAKLKTPFYVGTTLFPLELEDQNPAVKQAHDLTAKVGSKLPWDAGAIPAWESWVLFAQSATTCGDDLTVDCVIKNATTQKDFTAGGLMAPVDLTDPDAISPCMVVLSADGDGFHYERALTTPTDGVFNCDADNVEKAG